MIASANEVRAMKNSSCPELSAEIFQIEARIKTAQSREKKRCKIEIIDLSLHQVQIIALALKMLGYKVGPLNFDPDWVYTTFTVNWK